MAATMTAHELARAAEATTSRVNARIDALAARRAARDARGQ
jgi:DNA repair photolyase